MREDAREMGKEREIWRTKDGGKIRRRGNEAGERSGKGRGGGRVGGSALASPRLPFSGTLSKRPILLVQY